MNRIKYFDSLRLMAIFVVYLTHFIASFCPEFFSLWTQFPTSLLLEGVSGKLGVALFGVLLGYFAYISKENNSAYYILKRYAFFVISAVIINALYALQAFLTGSRISLFKVLIESITLDDDIFPTYWCIPIFFAASIFSYLNGKANVPTIGILLEIAILYKLGSIWLAVCLMGNLVARYQLNPCMDWLKNRMVRILLWIVLFLAVKRPECDNTYMIQGMCCACLIMLIMRGSVARKILEHHILASIGRQGMAIYILHPICYHSLAPLFFDWLKVLPYEWNFAITLLICFTLIVLFSFPTMAVINKATGLTGKLILKTQEFLQSKAASAK